MTLRETVDDRHHIGRVVGRAGGPDVVHIEADDADEAVKGSVEALREIGAWTEDASELGALPYIEYHRHARLRDLSRAVIARARRHLGVEPRMGTRGQSPAP